MKVYFVLALFSAYFSAILANSDRVVCYFTSWTTYRLGNGKFDTTDVDPSLCTHLVYSFVGLNEDGRLRLLGNWEANGLKGLTNLLDLKEKNPNLKLMISLGGWNEGAERCSEIAANPVKRTRFTQSVVNFIAEYGFDGFDLDWEYPCTEVGKDGCSEKKQNFAVLLKELKQALTSHGYILSAAVSGSKSVIDLSYDISEVASTLDMINIMTYNYHDDGHVTHSSPLHSSSHDTAEEAQQSNVAAGIEYWLQHGTDPQKINLGLTFYGRTYTLADSKNGSLFAATSGGGKAGPYTQTVGLLGYNEISEFYKDIPRYWDSKQLVPHKWLKDQWIGYDDSESLTHKVEYAKTKGLGGVMVWSLEADDFRGVSGEGKYPLMRAINKAIGRL